MKSIASESPPGDNGEMSRSTARASKKLIPGTTGWTVHDLDDPKIEADWEAGHYEIIEGALVTMPPAYYETTDILTRLVRIVEEHLRAKDKDARLLFELDLELGVTRVPKGDAVYMSPADRLRQKRASANAKKRRRSKFNRVRVPPTLVIENLSRGHEAADRVVKRTLYAQAGIPNYWILDAYQMSLECLALQGGQYALDQIGRGKARVTPSCFPGLTIELAKVWSD